MDPFIPHTLPIDKSNWNIDKILKQVSASSAALSEYKGILTNPVISPSIFLSPLETKEAVLSSKIEGTVTTLDEVLRFDSEEFEEDKKKDRDLLEVINYRNAMRLSRSWIDRGMPFNINLVLEIQKELMKDVRGGKKLPGKLRKEQVWIGSHNCKIEEATYVPPSPLNVPFYLQNLFAYLETDEDETLIQTSILHAQFEIIHPFMDGNGRVGRILIPLYLWVRKRLPSPMFYISEYLEKNREEYTHRLLMISQNDDWENWVLFFLTAIEKQAGNNSQKALQLLSLYNELKEKILKNSRSANAIKGLDVIFMTPLFTSSQFIKNTKMNLQTANRVLTFFKKENILETYRKPSGRAPEVFVFPRLYEMVKNE